MKCCFVSYRLGFLKWNIIVYNNNCSVKALRSNIIADNYNHNRLFVSKVKKCSYLLIVVYVLTLFLKMNFYLLNVFLFSENIVVAGVPMSGQKLAIFFGASIGILVCFLILIFGVIYLKYRRRKTLNDKARQSPTLGHLTGTHRSQGL